MKLILHTDGGASGNPGPAAAGIFITDEKGEKVAAFGKYLGEKTNNFAEYSALLLGLEKALSLKAEEIECLLDSELVVKQVKGEYKVKNPDLAGLFLKIYNLTQKFKKVSFRHVRREQNKRADSLVNQTLDKMS